MRAEVGLLQPGRSMAGFAQALSKIFASCNFHRVFAKGGSVRRRDASRSASSWRRPAISSTSAIVFLLILLGDFDHDHLSHSVRDRTDNQIIPHLKGEDLSVLRSQ